MFPRGMLHDPNIFTEPDRFYPERWFSPNVPDFPIQAFGFGARLCPGRVFARRSIWTNMAGILAAFDIVPTKYGLPEEKCQSGMASCVVLEMWNGTRANLTALDSVALAGTQNHSDAISAHAPRRQLRWYAIPRMKYKIVVRHTCLTRVL